MSGIRKKGSYGSASNTKPSFSVKLDEVVMGQNLDGIDRFALNNARQDPTFLAEHLAYELHRMAGLPAPRTAHGMVTLNGRPLGLYVIKEAIDKQFLALNFGRPFRGGNLYEGPCCVDFVTNPAGVELKNEKEEMRTRDGIIRLAELIRTTPVQGFEAAVSAKLKLDKALTTLAIESIVGHWDSYFFNSNNYYLYDDPTDGRFIFLPHGMDWLYSNPANEPDITTRPDPMINPFSYPNARLRGSRLTNRIREVPALDERYRKEVGRVAREVWDVDKLLARIEQARTVILGTARTDVQTTADLTRFRASLDRIRDYVRAGKAFVQSAAP
jgi:hypothetical protein